MTKDRIDSFASTSTAIYAQFPNLEEFIRSELSNLRGRWQDLLQMARNNRVTIDSSVSYFKMLDEVSSLLFLVASCSFFTLFITLSVSRSNVSVVVITTGCKI